MKRYFGALIIVLSYVFFTSCQKEIDWDKEDLFGNDSTTLQKLVVLDTNYVSGIDTVIKWELLYTSDKKLSRIYYTGYRNVAGPSRTLLFEELIYNYQGVNAYPESIIDKFSDPQDPSRNYSDTTFFTYNNGLIVKDSTISLYGYEVSEFTKLASNRYKMHQRSPDFISGGINIDTTYILVDWQNGNLLSETDSLWLPSLGFWNIEISLFNYDLKPNPFKSLALPYPTPANGDLPLFGIEALFMPTTNNMIRQVLGSGTYTILYEYGTNGLPKIGRDEDGLKIIFQYVE